MHPREHRAGLMVHLLGLTRGAGLTTGAHAQGPKPLSSAGWFAFTGKRRKSATVWPQQADLDEPSVASICHFGACRCFIHSLRYIAQIHGFYLDSL
jgi:hypothetical protein